MKNLFNTLEELRGKNPCGIYLLIINNKQYVGSSVNIKKRLRRHRTLLRNNKHDNQYLQHLYNKYKVCNYKILEEYDRLISFNELRIKERLWIKQLNAEINLDDPVKGIGGTNEKQVHQYTITGTYIKTWDSAMIASRILKINYSAIHQAANPKQYRSKSAHGFRWSYDKLEKLPEYINNTGNNLITRIVHLYNLDGSYHKSFKSLSDCGRYIAIFINYQGDWKIIRTTVSYVLQKPTTRKVRRKFFVSYKKSSTFQESIAGLQTE